MQVTISGNIVSILNRTLNIDDAIEERSTCSFTVIDIEGTKHFRKGQPVIITDDDGIRVFAGVIDSVTEEKPGSGNLLYHRVQCVDWHYLADKRIAAKTHENTLAGDIVQDLIDSYLREEGVMGTREQPTFNRDSVACLSDGTQVAANVPRFETGRFGQAVMVEEGTTNLVSNPGFENDATGWNLSGNMSISTAKAKSGSKALRFYLDTGAPSQDTLTSYYIPVSPNTQYTLSADFWNNLTQGNFYVDYFEYDSSYNILTDSANLNSTRGLAQWERKAFTFTTKPNAAYVRIRVVADAIPIGEAFVDNIQLEQKPYATSFIDGTRSPETLTIPTAGVLNPQEGTVECWVYVPEFWKPGIPYWRRIWGIGRSISAGMYVLRYYPPSGNIVFEIYDNSGTAQNISVAKPSVGWHYFAAKWSASEMALLIDGVKVGSITNPNLPSSFADTVLSIGCRPDSPYDNVNTLIDDLRISSHARTDEEIADAYNSGAPLPIDEWTTYKMGMDGSLTAQTPIAEGPSIKQAVINYRPVTEALEALAEKAGFVWYIDAYKVLHFVERAAYSAPWTASGSDMLRNSVSVEQANPKYRNRQYIKGGRDITDPQTETRKGDGNTKSFAMGFPIAKVPTVKVNGATKTVGIKGVDTGKDWYWSKGDPIIVQDESAAALTSSDTLEVTYQGEYDIVVISSDYSAIEDRKAVESGGTGYVEDVADEPDATSRDAAFESANAKLKRYAVIGRRLKFRTKKAGLRPAQLLTVNLPKHELNNAEMLIESVTTYDENGIIFYDITAVEGPEQGSWSKMFALMATRGLAFVERINIGENEILIVLHTVSESWPWAENVTVDVFACPVPSTTLYPSSTLYPC